MSRPWLTDALESAPRKEHRGSTALATGTGAEDSCSNFRAPWSGPRRSLQECYDDQLGTRGPCGRVWSEAVGLIGISSLHTRVPC